MLHLLKTIVHDLYQTEDLNTYIMEDATFYPSSLLSEFARNQDLKERKNSYTSL